MLVLNNSCHKNTWMIFEGCHRLYNIHIFEALFLHVVAGDWFWIFPPHEQNALPWMIPVRMSRCLKSAYSYLIIEQRDNVPLSLCSMGATKMASWYPSRLFCLILSCHLDLGGNGIQLEIVVSTSWWRGIECRVHSRPLDSTMNGFWSKWHGAIFLPHCWLFFISLRDLTN